MNIEKEEEKESRQNEVNAGCLAAVLTPGSRKMRNAVNDVDKMEMAPRDGTEAANDDENALLSTLL